MGKSTVQKSYLSKLVTILILSTLPLLGLGLVTAANAADVLETRMGQTLTFKASQALSQTDWQAHSKDCSASGYSMQVLTSGTEEVVFESSETFETEHCLNQPTQWLDVFTWDQASCTTDSSVCISMPNESRLAPAGDYNIRFILLLEGATPTQLENTFSVAVLPACFYMFSDYTSEIFPHKDGYLDNVTGSLEFWNDSGEYLQNYPTAKLALKQGTKTLATTELSDDGSFSFPELEKLNGKFNIVMLSIQNPAGGKRWVSAQTTVEGSTKTTKLGSFSLSASATVFPSKDGYLDSATITTSNSLTTGKRGKISGDIKILKGNQVLKTFPLSMSGTKSVSWDGKIGGRIVEGIYSIVASAKGPEGGTIRKTTSIKVSSKKWVYKTISKTFGAYSVADESQGTSFDPIEKYGSSGARFYSSGDGDTMVVKLSIPVNSKTVKWRIRFNEWETSDGFFLYMPCRTSNCLSSFVSNISLGFSSYDSGTTWSPWASLQGGTANFSIGSTDWASLYVDSFTIEYVTKLLK
ncbi:MAG: hypothetical protein EBS85_06645 [Micrococcales bacterium]|nr:hypothetical protein [Micrococcales bacterium]